MLRVKLLRNLLILSLAIAVLFPGYEYLYVHPAYNDLLTKETESEAVRYASYMVRTLGLENQLLVKERLPEGLQERLQPVSRDKRLLKLRIFSARGEMIFSTLPEEIGTVNENSYFREIVAKGQVYSKVVKKDRMTAEGDVSQIDIVETYVPFMASQDFGGAIEVYYDITASVSRVKQLSLHSIATTLLMSLGFLLAIYIALSRAHVSLLERDKAEEALRVANDALEQRVAERTQELSIANEQLTGQIVERTEAQMALGQALEEIRVDREKLEGILTSVPDGVVVTDGELRVLHMNAAAESILSTSLERALGRSLGVFSTSDVDFVKKVTQRLDANYDFSTFDFEVPVKDPVPSRIYQVRISRLVADESKSPGVILLLRDVSRERDIERMKSAFLGMAAHELNTPLTTIIGFSELLTAEETAGIIDSAQQKDYLELIHNKALALSGLVDDLLDVSRVESGRPLNLNCREFDFPALVHDVVATFRGQYSQHRFAMVMPEEALLCADRARLAQVVEHLVSNAVKYSPGGGAVRVVVSALADQYELCVTDEGIGMNEEQLMHVFDRFYRADSSDTAVQGVGLGMSIVRHIVLAHHGDIHIESQPGSGTRVCITLPMTPPADDAGSKPHVLLNDAFS